MAFLEKPETTPKTGAAARRKAAASARQTAAQGGAGRKSAAPRPPPAQPGKARPAAAAAPGRGHRRRWLVAGTWLARSRRSAGTSSPPELRSGRRWSGTPFCCHFSRQPTPVWTEVF